MLTKHMIVNYHIPLEITPRHAKWKTVSNAYGTYASQSSYYFRNHT